MTEGVRTLDDNTLVLGNAFVPAMRKLLPALGYEVDQWDKVSKNGEPCRCRYCGHWIRVKRLAFFGRIDGENSEPTFVCKIGYACELELRQELSLIESLSSGTSLQGAGQVEQRATSAECPEDSMSPRDLNTGGP